MDIDENGNISDFNFKRSKITPVAHYSDEDIENVTKSQSEIVGLDLIVANLMNFHIQSELACSNNIEKVMCIANKCAAQLLNRKFKYGKR